MSGKFGAYEILHELKSGGMGSVLLARRRGPGSFEQLVAIKTIRSDFAGVKAVRDMFLDEAAILARLNHPGVATVHDFGEEAGQLYMVMEYVAGIPFRDVIELHPPPTIIARAIAEACRGLHAAHELHDLHGNQLGLVHRDISPDNLMLGFDGHVKVIDFGIALVKNRQAPVTEFGAVKGKPPYMSPEQVKNEPIDRRSDVFSLGIVLWELLTEKPLFDGETIFQIAYAVDNQPIELPSRVMGVELPVGLDAAVMNALDRDLSTRLPTAAALAEQLEQVLRTSGGESLEAWAARELAPARDAHRKWLAGVVAGTQLPKAVGRATGEVTELAAQPGATPSKPNKPNALAVAPTIASSPGELSPDTSIGGTAPGSEAFLPPRRRIAPIALALVLVLIGGIGAFMALRPTAASTQRDAAIDIAVARDASLDAPIDIAMIDAADTIDAFEAPARLDAGRRHTVRADAAIKTVSIDAAVVPVATGAGTITIRVKPDAPFLNIYVDGDSWGSTPVVRRKLAAGPHTVVLRDPATNAVVLTQQLDIQDGKLVTIVAP